MISSGFNRNFLPQFVIILWKFPLPLSSKTLIASPKTPRLRLFSWSTCVTHSCRSISQPVTQLSDWHFISISIHSIFIVLNGSLCIVYFWRSLRDLLDLNNTKAAISVCLSFLSFVCFLKELSVPMCFVFNWNVSDFELGGMFPALCFLLLLFCSNICRVFWGMFLVGLGWLFNLGWNKII